ncbi:MAG: hypothetical protein IJ877_08240 [Candidatus Gastranaerophilales bacterium]|nr:hypothetical protein [Candidatus Gastranaerophilales bacterium]
MTAIATNITTAKIFLLLNQNEDRGVIDDILAAQNYEYMEASGEADDILTQIHHYMPDIILADSKAPDCELIIKQVKSASKNQNAQIILFLDNETPFDVLNTIEGFVQKPLKTDILLSIINSHLKIKKSLDRLYENNKELSRSLYQLNVLYNTSSQFAGTLNTDKLYEIMIEAMEKTLSFDISSVILFNTAKKPVFKLNTIHTPSENLIDALKIRSILNYQSVCEDRTTLAKQTFEDVEVVKKVKQERSNKVYGLESVSFDSLFAPIKVGDEIYGVVELFRQIPFSSEDVTCFQAIAHQVALPLRSAKLYEEISITNKKLEKLEKLKSEFISIVSHELRTPLTPINNSLDIVLNEDAGKISDDAKNFISMAKRNIQRLSGIIEDLLDLSRIQAGKLDFKYKNVDITSSLELLKNTFTQVASEKNITINLDIKEKLPEIYADTRRIEQIFTNLVSNSLKFTPDNGEINVKANVVNEEDIDFSELISPVAKLQGKYIKISVSDNGIGMKKEDIPKIFDKFSQIESSLNRNKGGVGLGLSITKQLIDSHLGAISVNSKEKAGSTFSVFLPLKDDKKIFEMNLMRDMTNNEDIGIARITHEYDFDLINELKDMKLIKNTPLLKELLIKKDNYTNYIFYIPKISYDSFNALFSAIENYCNQKYENITLIKSHSAKDGDNIKELAENI